MITCWDCQTRIPDPSSHRRYCPNCGFVYALPCSHIACVGNAGSLVFAGRDGSCRECGTLYRYDPISKQPIKTLTTGPFLSEDQATSLVDFDPSVEDLAAETAFRLEHQISSEGKPGFASTLIGPLTAVKARHQRLYVLTRQRGEIRVFDAETLTPLRSWINTFVPEWRANPAAGDISFDITATLVLVRKRHSLYGYDAGRGGGPLFTLQLAEHNPYFAAFNDQLLCVQATPRNGTSIKLYSLSTLAGARGQQVEPLRVWETDPNPLPGVHIPPLPPQRFLPYGDRAFYWDASGKLNILDYKTGQQTRIFANVEGQRVVAWAGTPKRGVALLEPNQIQDPYSLLRFDPQQHTFELESLRTASLLTLRPHHSLNNLLIREDDLYLLSEWREGVPGVEHPGCMWRVSLNALADRRLASVNLIQGREVLLGIAMLPLRDQAFACVHTKNQARHFFHVARLNTTTQDGYGAIDVGPFAEHTANVASAQEGFIVTDLDEGTVSYASYRHIMQPRPRRGQE